MSSTLQDLRKEAGFRTAKDFAEAVGIPAPTYTRYEQDPLKIPIDRAWKIADGLHCSIDAVVGREHIDVNDMRGDFQKNFDSLSPDSQGLLEVIAAAIKGRENVKKKEARAKEEARYDAYLSYYEQAFVESLDAGSTLGDSVIFGSDKEKRIAFERYLFERAAKKRAEKVEANCAPREEELTLNAASIIDTDGKTVFCDDPRFDELIENSLRAIREELEEEYRKQDEAEIEKIMAAYDRLHPRHNTFEETVRHLILHYGDTKLSDIDEETVEQGRKAVESMLAQTSEATPSAVSPDDKHQDNHKRRGSQ
ncbi:helix-turn-helix domain-containing protein [Olsenella porci]|uniref:helix-turn-helix domain-containing protein n=1 Tax=Olsenella porci TaxID=2652279 RepID=UPI0012B39DE2|nr:helix-turn-helix transcriptional regulator [Olsenella porci]